MSKIKICLVPFAMNEEFLIFYWENNRRDVFSFWCWHTAFVGGYLQYKPSWNGKRCIVKHNKDRAYFFLFPKENIQLRDNEWEILHIKTNVPINAASSILAHIRGFNSCFYLYELIFI